MMLDFEIAVINAFYFHFPNIQIILCFFHFGHSLFRKICSVGLKEEYLNNENLKSWTRKVIALALVPPDQVADLFCELCYRFYRI